MVFWDGMNLDLNKIGGDGEGDGFVVKNKQ